VRWGTLKLIKDSKVGESTIKDSKVGESTLPPNSPFNNLPPKMRLRSASEARSS
jgi:hypothetical protein